MLNTWKDHVTLKGPVIKHDRIIKKSEMVGVLPNSSVSIYNIVNTATVDGPGKKGGNNLLRFYCLQLTNY